MNISKKIPFVKYFVRLVRNLFGITPESLTLNYHLKRKDFLIKNYLNENNSSKKLQIGCQIHNMKQWLNVDILPKNDDIVYMDATKKFPLPDNTFSHVFSEHMIEHIGFEDGIFMVKECYRVMKKGGRIRLVTPNLKFLINLYTEPKSDLQNDYIKFNKRYFSDDKLPLTDTLVINNFFRDWGHQFIYDEKTLEFILTDAGFKNVTFLKVNESSDVVLCNLEKHGLEITDRFNELESIIVEAEK